MFYSEPRSPQGKTLWQIVLSFRQNLKEQKLLPRASYSSHREKEVAEWLYYHERELVEAVEKAETEYGLHHGLVKPGETVALCVVTGCNHFFNLSDDSDEYECPQHRRVLDVEPPLLKSEVVSPAERHRHAMAVRDQMLRVQTRNRLAQLRAEAAAL